jgi:uncharacterized protein DUF4236
MRLRYFRRFRLAPGLTFNLSKRGASVSVSVCGAHLTVGTRGTRETVGLPGTGLFLMHERWWRAPPHRWQKPSDKLLAAVFAKHRAG